MQLRGFGSWFVSCVLTVGCAATAPNESTTQALHGVPEPAAATLKREAGAAPIDRVDRESEGGKFLYEGRWYIDGRLHEVAVTATGEIVEREEELAPDQVPQPVRVAAIAALPPNSKVVFVRLLSGH